MYSLKILQVSFLFQLLVTSALAQPAMKPVEELIDKNSMAWDGIVMKAGHSKNKVQILPVDSIRACKALYQSQLSTGTSLGALIYHCGGILVDHGWIRILASGCTELPRSLPDWNREKLAATRNEDAFYLLVADDVLGGLFAIKSSSIEGLEKVGQVFYFGPNSLSWQPTGLSYSGFLSFCFSGDLKEFYEGFRWKGWEEEVRNVDGGKVISCYPLLWTREGLQMKANRKVLPIQTQWTMYQGKPRPQPRSKTLVQRTPSKGKPAPASESMWLFSNHSN